MKHLKKIILNGKIIDFDNEKFCNENMTDDLMSGYIGYRGRPRNGFFIIWFNGKCIALFKSWSATEKRLTKLMSDWNLEIAN